MCSQALALLEKDFAGQALCGIKDPRASRLMPFWQSVFATADIRDCYVIALRTPGSVARSLSARKGDKILYKDTDHLTLEGSMYLSDKFMIE